MSRARAVALRAQATALEAQAAALRAEADAVDVVPIDPGIEYATPAEASRIFEVSLRTIFAWCEEGLPSVKRGARRRINVQAAREWLAETRTR